MRPLRLMLEGFGSYRQPGEVDFSDVDFFVLIGPTGSGKSTVIDAICFALYGTVPRWGKGNMISLAMAPSETRCRVCLVFEAYGGRYAAVRVLIRNSRGQVQTKEARLDRLDDSVPADADLTEILSASVQQLAEGSDVTEHVERLLGLTYEHFTQCVMLPQGKFAEFLQARPADRQDLLVQLLAYGVYAEIGQKARGRAAITVQKIELVQAQRDELAAATQDAEDAALARQHELTELATVLDTQLADLVVKQQAAQHADTEAASGRDALVRVAAAKLPPGVTDLADQLRVADRGVSEAQAFYAERQKQADDTDAELAPLGDEQRHHEWLRDYQDMHQLAATLAEQEQAHAKAIERHLAADQAAGDAASNAAQAAKILDQAKIANSAAALAADLHAGDPCPVCGKKVTTVPHHDIADLKKLERGATAAARAEQKARTEVQGTATAVATAAAQRGASNARYDEIAARLANVPAESVVASTLGQIQTAKTAAAAAAAAARTARAAFAQAQANRSRLNDAERSSREQLATLRDTVVDLGAPVLREDSLAKSWSTLVDWCAREHTMRERAQQALDAAVTRTGTAATAAAQAIQSSLAKHALPTDPDPGQARVVVGAEGALAEESVRVIRADRAKAAELDAQVYRLREDRQVASMLGGLLHAGKFERWLCGEALDTLVAHASDTLMRLSSGQYELDRNDRNELIVIDYNDAGTSRPVNTLSGGETFQASLALALALAHQVVELSAGRRELDSMFLDEGFGTLDDTTLDTVASTLETLASDDERMVGVITHVPALADRIPVRFVINRDSTGSHLTKERV